VPTNSNDQFWKRDLASRSTKSSFEFSRNVIGMSQGDVVFVTTARLRALLVEFIFLVTQLTDSEELLEMGNGF
jgi:hypothetical protein